MLQTRYNLPVPIGLKQMSVLDLRRASCTIDGLPKDPSHTSVGLSRDVHSMIVLKWWIWKFHYFQVKILKILVGPNENLNREKLINRSWANLNSSQFAFVTKMNEDSWKFLILAQRKQHSIWKIKFFLFEQKTITQDGVLRTRWNILDETSCEKNFFFRKSFILDLSLGSVPSQKFDWVLNMPLNNRSI